MNDGDSFVARLYPEARRQKRRVPLGRRLNRWVRHNTWKLSFFLALFLAWVAAHIYWYNKLTDLEYNIQASWAQVEAEQERRYHIQQDLTRLVMAYAEHERGLMRELTELRTEAWRATAGGRAGGARAGAPDGADRGADRGAVDRKPAAQATGAAASLAAQLDELPRRDLDRLFPQIMLAAEQYPNLRLTENFQQFSTAIIETETRIAEHIKAYNDAVNMYTTTLKQFPGNIFGAVWGFEMYDFYVPDREGLKFRPVEYETTESAPADDGRRKFGYDRDNGSSR